jgi:hypothetical protein
MKEDSTIIDTLFERVKEYSIAYVELLKLRAIDFGAEVFSSILPDLIFTLLILVVLLFLNLALALWLGDVTGRLYLGFLLVGGFYLLLGFASRLFMRGWFKRRIGDYFVKHIFRHTDL